MIVRPADVLASLRQRHCARAEPAGQAGIRAATGSAALLSNAIRGTAVSSKSLDGRWRLRRDRRDATDFAGEQRLGLSVVYFLNAGLNWRSSVLSPRPRILRRDRGADRSQLPVGGCAIRLEHQDHSRDADARPVRSHPRRRVALRRLRKDILQGRQRVSAGLRAAPSIGAFSMAFALAHLRQ